MYSCTWFSVNAFTAGQDFVAGAVYICTEDVFPNKRLVQMVDLLKKRCHIPSVSDIKFTDNIFIEHAAELVSEAFYSHSEMHTSEFGLTFPKNYFKRFR